MKPYNPFKEKCPERIAHVEGNTYECWNIDCWAMKAKLHECGKSLHSNGRTYTPYLRCEECGTVYFGLPTPYNPPAPPAQETKKREEKKDDGIILPNMLTF